MSRYINALFAILFCFNMTMVQATVGPNRIGDCGQPLIQPDDPLSLLTYLPGDLPPNDDCAFPNVARMMVDRGEPGVISGWCNASLLHVDNKKAVILTAAHCLNGDGVNQDPVFVVFEPQPTTPFTARRDRSLTVNLHEAVARSVHPLNNGELTPWDVGLLFLDNSEGQISNLGLTPTVRPPVANYLESIGQGKLKTRHSFIGVAAVGGEPLLGNDPDHTPADGFDARRRAQGARTISEFDLLGFGRKLFGEQAPGLTDLIEFNSQTAAGRDGVCFGDSGSPIFLDGVEAIGVATLVWGFGKDSQNWCVLQHAYTRIDIAETVSYLDCSTDSAKSIADAADCGQPPFD